MITASLLFCGCSDSESAPDTKPEGARLTAREVVEIAKRVGATNGITLSDYKKPEVSYRAAMEKTWSVFFDGRVPMPGHHFSVFVDDLTGEARYSGGR